MISAMHAAKIKDSARLQRALAVLGDRKDHSTWDIVQKAHICAVNSVVAELRVNHYNIKCWREDGVFYYRLLSGEQGALPLEVSG